MRYIIRTGVPINFEGKRKTLTFNICQPLRPTYVVKTMCASTDMYYPQTIRGSTITGNQFGNLCQIYLSGLLSQPSFGVIEINFP